MQCITQHRVEKEFCFVSITIILTNLYTPSFFLWQDVSYPVCPVVQVTDLEDSVIPS